MTPAGCIAALACFLFLGVAYGAVSVSVDAVRALGVTDPLFASFSFDTTALFGVERLALPFDSPQLLRLARNLAPAYVRFGGSLQDQVVSNVTGEFGAPLPTPADFPQYYLNASSWGKIAALCDNAGLSMVYGLNAKMGRAMAPFTWNSSNARVHLAYARASGSQQPRVVELGNEVNVFNCSGVANMNISAAQIAAEYAEMRSILSEVAPETELWGVDPSITGDLKGQCHSWYGADLFGFYADFLKLAAPLLNATTWHWYSQFQGDPTSSASLVMSDEYQNRIVPYDSLARAAVAAHAPGLRMVLGETASFWGGGLMNVSNRFASGFWYLNQLGFVAAKNYRTHIRQDLAGGDYGLLECVLDAAGACVAFTPNADYFTHALFQRLVSRVVVSASVGSGGADATGVRAWAWCAAGFTGEAVIAASNFNATAARLALAFAAVAGAGSAAPAALDLYALTAGDAALGLASATVRLNGALLTLGPNDALPPMLPLRINSSSDVTLPPSSYGFIVTSGLRAPLCMAPPDDGVTAA